jgi:spermidine/putrescine transport system permease protein
MMRRIIVLIFAIVPLCAFIGFPILMLMRSSVIDDSGAVSFEALKLAVSNETYLSALFSTLWLCTLTAICAVALALPVSLFVWSRPSHWRPLALFLIILPMFMSYIVKIYTMRSLMGLNGLFNQLLVGTGILTEPTTLLLFNRGAILATFVVLYIPFAALPIYLSLERIPANMVLASRDLGASYGRALRDIVIPLAAPGIVAAALFAFILALGDFITPQMVGGPNGMTFGRIVWSQFGLAFNYPLGASLGIVLLVVTLLAMTLAALTSRFLLWRSQ